jgi:hypothetical protein
MQKRPAKPRRINEELLRLMERDGVKGIYEIIGAGCPSTY